MFALAMGYQVFLISRIHEAHVRGLSTRVAIRDGFGRAAVIVAAAAPIMASVFFGFGFSGSTLVASLAFALSVGVLVDAFVVRMIVIPASLTLFGMASGWIPQWLDRLLPTIDTEGPILEGVHPPGQPLSDPNTLITIRESGRPTSCWPATCLRNVPSETLPLAR